MRNAKFAFVAFFEVFPVNFGSSVVCKSLFKYWPYRKKFFQLSNQKYKQKNIKNIFHHKSKIGKLLAIPMMFFYLKNYLNGRKNYIFIEGASWAGYSYFLICLIKLFSRNIKIIYKSHSIEYEIRKKNNGFIVAFLTKLFEKKIYQSSDIATSVSQVEKKKIMQYYKVNTLLFYNTIDFKPTKRINLNLKPYIFFSGSYDYKPNAYSIDQLINKIIPLLRNEVDLNLYILGNNKLKYKKHWLRIEKTNKKKYINIMQNAVALVVPSNESYGSKIKIIEALCYGLPVITTKTGFKGIDKINNYQPLLASNNKQIIAKIFYLLKNKKKCTKNASKVKKKYISMHDIKKNVHLLEKKIKLL